MDFWDWFKSLRRWWWIIVLFPLLAAGIAWFTAPEPEYESRWTINVVFDDPNMANSPTYFDFIFLDDFHLLLQTGAFGDVMYLRLPEDMHSRLSRDEFGEMVDSSRKAHFVEIIISGDDPDIVRVVAETIEANSQEIANHYLVPPTYQLGEMNVNTLDPITEPALNTQPKTVFIGSVSVGAFLTGVAATGVAEWLRLSYRAKYADK